MMKGVISALALGLAQTVTARAEAPHVVADIAPVHSLVAQVMRGLGSPVLILRPGVSPHDYALRPSEAAALQEADLAIWTGAALTPWLEAPLGALAGEAKVLGLLDSEGTLLLEYREEVGTHDEHDHAGHDEDHGEDHEGHHHHDGVDPHAWLDPGNARLWLGQMAQALSDIDPENAARYRQNAEEGKAAIDEAVADARRMLETFDDTRYIVFHDAWQYFESAFDVHPSAAIALGDAAAPGPARIAALRALVTEAGIVCAFSEPQFNDAMIETVFEGGTVRHGVLDPMGTAIAPGPDFYPELLRSIARGMADCAP